MTDLKDPQADIREAILKIIWAKEPGESIPMEIINRQVDGLVALFQAHQQELLSELLDEAMVNEEITYGGMGSDIPCIPVSVIQSKIGELNG